MFTHTKEEKTYFSKYFRVKYTQGLKRAERSPLRSWYRKSVIQGRPTLPVCLTWSRAVFFREWKSIEQVGECNNGCEVLPGFTTRVCFSLQEKAVATVMGVLALRLLVCGQLILFSLVVNNITNAQQISESPSKAPPLNATGNLTENNASNSSSNSNNDSNTAQNFTTQATTIGFNSTTGPTQINVTVTGSAEQSNSTENAQTTQSATSSTININSTAVTSTDNSTQGNNETATSSTTPLTKSTAIPSPTVTQNNTIFSNESIAGGGLNHSEKSMTILFSVLLGVIVLVILMNFVYKYGRSKERSIQYTHRRLQNEDAGESFAVSDDTLVISGGLYDGPQIYNPTMTVQNEEEFQTDVPGFVSRPTQFRLEFLGDDQDRASDNEISTFQTFHANDQEP